MVILAVGVLAIVSMQTASIQALAVSQDITNATNLGEQTMEMIRLDALRWTNTTTLSGNTKILSAALPPTMTAGAQGTWKTIPDNVIIASMGGKRIDRNFAPDTLGAPDWPLGFRYCVHYRLTWVNPPVGLRAEVRVAWSKRSGDFSKLVDCQAQVGNVTDIVNVRSTTLSTVLVANPLGGG